MQIGRFEPIDKDDPRMREYFSSLPAIVQESLRQSGVEISTLGELKKCAEHFMQQL